MSAPRRLPYSTKNRKMSSLTKKESDHFTDKLADALIGNVVKDLRKTARRRKMRSTVNKKEKQIKVIAPVSFGSSFKAVNTK